jgi:hypothetical protein
MPKNHQPFGYCKINSALISTSQGQTTNDPILSPSEGCEIRAREDGGVETCIQEARKKKIQKEPAWKRQRKS